MSQELFQNVRLEFSNGQIVKATVPAFWDVGSDLEVIKIQVTEPMPLPEGAYWDRGEDNDSVT